MSYKEQLLALVLEEEKRIVNEHITNLFQDDEEEKRKYAEQVMEVIKRSYEYIGGIKTKGFDSIENMIALIPMWKLAIRDGKVIAVSMYKDKKGRKMVACGSDGSRDGKLMVKRFIKDDITLNRSYSEVSENVLKFIIKEYGADWVKYAIPSIEAIQLIGKDKAMPIDQYRYHRILSNGEKLEKVMFGKPNLPITR